LFRARKSPIITCWRGNARSYNAQAMKRRCA
jgi:hypothetical protein